MLDIGHWALDVGCLPVSCWLSVVGHWLLVVGCHFPLQLHQLQFATEKLTHRFFCGLLPFCRNATNQPVLLARCHCVGPWFSGHKQVGIASSMRISFADDLVAEVVGERKEDEMC